VGGAKGLVVIGAASDDFRIATGVDPDLIDVHWSLFDSQHPGDDAAVADAVICCHKRDFALALELPADLLVQQLLMRFHRQEDVGPLHLQLLKNGFLACRASAWMRTPSRFSSFSNCRCNAHSLLSELS
jgi:hypothetical protein